MMLAGRRRRLSREATNSTAFEKNSSSKLWYVLDYSVGWGDESRFVDVAEAEFGDDDCVGVDCVTTTIGSSPRVSHLRWKAYFDAQLDSW
jgi:hypothetical protein